MLAIVTCLAAGAALAQDGEQPQPPAAPSVNPLSGLDRNALSGFLDLPLFSPSRTRPQAEEEPEEEIVAPPAAPVRKRPDPPTLKLSGIVQGPEESIAVVEEDGEVEQLRVGDQVGGWLVTAIDPAALTLTFDDQEEEYRLFESGGGGAASDASNEEAP